MAQSESEKRLRKIEEQIEKLLDEIRISARRKTGEKFDSSLLQSASRDFFAAVPGALALPVPGSRPAAAILAGLGLGSLALAREFDQKDKLDVRSFTLNEAVEAFRQNQEVLRTTTPGREQSVASSGNRAIVEGLLRTQEGFQNQVALFRQLSGTSFPNTPMAAEALRNLEATEQVLREIAAIITDPDMRGLLDGGIGSAGLTPDAAPPVPRRRPFTFPSIPRRRPFTFPPVPRRKPVFPGESSSSEFDIGPALGLGVEEFSARLLPETGTPIGDRLNALVDEERNIGRLVETHRKLIDEKKQLALTNQVVVDSMRLIDQAAERAGATIASAFERAIFEGGSLSDILKDLARDLSRIGVQTFVTGPLQGIFTDILNGSIFGPGGSGGPPFDPGVSLPGFGALSAAADAQILANPGIFHQGGVAGRTNVPSRLVPASFFADAPRLDQSGFAGFRNDEIPAILQRGETVRTPAQEAALQGRPEGGVTVNVTINTTGGAGDVNSMRFAAQQSFAEAARQLKRADARNN